MGVVVNTAGNRPFTVVVVEGIRLPAYVAGGLNVSIPDLVVVDHATVYPHKASGVGYTSGFFADLVVSSGSGNVVTVTAVGRGGLGSGIEVPAGTLLSSQPYAILAFGH